jgi:hypothetical protein
MEVQLPISGGADTPAGSGLEQKLLATVLNCLLGQFGCKIDQPRRLV